MEYINHGKVACNVSLKFLNRMSYEADQARLLYLVEETNPYVSEDEPDNVEVLDINMDSEQIPKRIVLLQVNSLLENPTSLEKMNQQSGKHIFLRKT
ncbi:hypothetical protein NQ314_010931 [Rhamnusium bicolor]|uniref:Uncharacterized protein n=1 Tax=Rhamnusium bicolor TaxID=1586634 RepID=A0AAV8XNK1_9CUCU|nr:hypothetical protein NQ314_010931 [Rhamnusium bicolor]